MPSTRRFVLTAGTGAAVVAATGAGAWALTRAPAKARAPWSRAGQSFGDPRLDALAFAILAPNPHNMQPWRIRLEGDDALAVYADLGRLLPATDPRQRQITVGFGCFLELLRQAGAEKSYRVDIDPFPEGDAAAGLDDRPVARVRFVSDRGVARDPLFAAALDRRTHREPFDLGRALPAGALDAIAAASVPGVYAAGTAEPSKVARIRDIARAAWRTEWATDATRRESIMVTRIGKAEINAAPYGLGLSGPAIEALALTGLLSRDAMDRRGTTSYEQTLAFYDKPIDTSSAFVWSITPSNARVDQLAAGHAWVRMHLAATGAGLAFHPLSQALQEFPEMADIYSSIHALLASGGGIVQMLARVGYGKPVPPAAREPLEAKLLAR